MNFVTSGVEPSTRMLRFESLSWEISELHKDLLAFRARTEQWFDRIESCLGDGCNGIAGDLDEIGRDIASLRRDLPGIVRDAVHEVLRERASTSEDPVNRRRKP
jgi:hypothetical protein